MFDIFKVVSQYQKLSEDVKHITMYSHDIEKLKELLNESTDSQSN